MRSTAVFTATLRSCTTAGYCLPGSELALSWSPCVHVVRFLCVCPSCLGPVASPDSRPLASASPQPLSLGPRCSFWPTLCGVALPRRASHPGLIGAARLPTHACGAICAACCAGAHAGHGLPLPLPRPCAWYCLLRLPCLLALHIRSATELHLYGRTCVLRS